MPRAILIIGAMKSGTTTLFDLLAAHPDVVRCRRKEPGFFAFEESWALGLSWYEALFSRAPGRDPWFLDGSTDYTKAPFCTGIADRLAASEREGWRFKLVYVVRHPLRRIESHARHVQMRGKEVGQSPSPRRDHGLDHGVSPVSMAVARYAEQLEPYADFHERGDLKILSFEELVADQNAAMARLLGFLGLDPAPVAGLELHSNLGGKRTHGPSALDAVGHGRLAAAARAITPPALRRRLRDWTRVPEKPIEGRFKLTPAEEAAILTELAPDLAELEARYGVDVEGFWNIRPADHMASGASGQRPAEGTA